MNAAPFSLPRITVSPPMKPLELDRWIRRHTRERFGPVRSVDPVHVFELAFEGISASSRHKSGVALRFPRILRWRRDKPAAEADRLEDFRERL